MTGQKLAVYVLSRKKSDKLVSQPSSKNIESRQNTTAKIDVIEKSNNGKFVYHTVQPGDSLWKIAQRYEGSTVEKIKSMNNLQSNDLKVGTKLKVVING
jgi:membrane-bound lytic murein transglycosylase D